MSNRRRPKAPHLRRSSNPDEAVAALLSAAFECRRRDNDDPGRLQRAGLRVLKTLHHRDEWDLMAVHLAWYGGALLTKLAAADPTFDVEAFLRDVADTHGALDRLRREKAGAHH